MTHSSSLPQPFPVNPQILQEQQYLSDVDHPKIRIAWVTRSFLDYRVPVYASLDKMVCGNLYLIYSADYVPERPQRKLRDAIGNRAIGLKGEWKIGREDKYFMANRNVSLRFQPGLWQAIRKVAPDVLVVDGFFKWSLVAFLYRIFTRTPIVVLYERTFHTERNAQWFRTAYRKLALRFTNAMSCNGRLSRDYAQWLGMPSDRITVGHMAADVDALKERVAGIDPQSIAALRAKWGASANSIVFLYVGRMIAQKGLKEFIQGWTLLNELTAGNVQSRALFVMVGGGMEEENLRKQASDLGLTNVRFTGELDYDKLAIYYASSDVFVIPTLEDNWSLVVPEAMACGLPILCSQFNGCWPELVHQDINGWVFDPLDPRDILKCIQACITTRICELRRMGDRSKIIIEEHTPNKAAEAAFLACRYAISNSNKRTRAISRNT